MPVYRSQPIPFVMVSRDILLNADLSPTSRLLYAVLLASLDEEMDFDLTAPLVGAKDFDDLTPHLEELRAAGAVSMGDHVGRGEVLTVHELPVPPAQRTHACVPCEDCGDCSCEYIKGICQRCYNIRHVVDQAKADVDRWKAQREAGATYAIGQHATRLHRWDCPTLNTVEKSWAHLEMQKPHAQGGISWSRLPDLYTAEELRLRGVKKRNCATCGPDPL